ncbi:MAG: dihydrodipicolinate synthase family protein [Chloroflexota bacterium]
MSRQLYGVVPPMTTPFDQREEIDTVALRAEVNYLIEEAGVHGIAVGGSTGEGHTLTTDEIRHVVGTAVSEAAGRVPIVAGIIVDSTRQAVERAQAIADLDVAALQVTPVHYLFKPTDDAMHRHFATLAEKAVAPIIIYNVVPWCYCAPELLVRLITEVEGVIGVKQSAGDLKTLADLLLMLDDKGLVMAATDALLYPAYALGAHGSIAAILQAAPKLSVTLWDAVQAGDQTKALALHKKLLRIWNAIEANNLPANVKTAMRLQKRPSGIPRAPMPESSPAQEAAIQAALTS